jgi:hypothetical protein
LLKAVFSKVLHNFVDNICFNQTFSIGAVSPEDTIQAIDSEDIVWSTNIKPVLPSLAMNVRMICQHGFTKILNLAA